MKFNFPKWVIFHVPHDSTHIPYDIQNQFILSTESLQKEFVKMTDFWTLALYSNGIPVEQTVVSPISRLVVDVERFADDSLESMSGIGMGVIYQKTHDLKTLRRELSAAERSRLLREYYYPHHYMLTRKVKDALSRYGKVLIIDLHSFSSEQLPYEGPLLKDRPEVCIGTDPYHTSSEISEAFYQSFNKTFDTGLNAPFSGALVPQAFYLSDPRVSSVMIETRRDLYEDEKDAELLDNFTITSKALKSCLSAAVSSI